VSNGEGDVCFCCLAHAADQLGLDRVSPPPTVLASMLVSNCSRRASIYRMMIASGMLPDHGITASGFQPLTASAVVKSHIAAMDPEYIADTAAHIFLHFARWTASGPGRKRCRHGWRRPAPSLFTDPPRNLPVLVGVNRADAEDVIEWLAAGWRIKLSSTALGVGAPPHRGEHFEAGMLTPLSARTATGLALQHLLHRVWVMMHWGRRLVHAAATLTFGASGLDPAIVVDGRRSCTPWMICARRRRYRQCWVLR